MSIFSKKHADTPRRRLATNDTANVPKKMSGIFKRNRTLAGTTSNYLSSLDVKSGLESPRVHVHHLTTKRRKIFSIFITVILFAIFLWILISQFTATVSISVSDTSISKSINAAKYEDAIQSYFDINPLSRFQFLLDQNALSAYVVSKLPEVESVTEKNVIGIGITNFSITMRVPVAGWRINDNQYYVDSKGVSFEQNYFAPPAVQIIDNSGASLKTGEASVSKRFLGFIGLAVSLSKKSGYTVDQAILPTDTTRELEIKLKDNNLLVKLSIDRSAGEQIEDMSRAIQYFVSHNQMPTYIDVRVSGKAFYK